MPYTEKYCITILNYNTGKVIIEEYYTEDINTEELENYLNTKYGLDNIEYLITPEEVEITITNNEDLNLEVTSQEIIDQTIHYRITNDNKNCAKCNHQLDSNNN